MKKVFNRFLTFGLSIAMLFGFITSNPLPQPTVTADAATTADSYYSSITATEDIALLGQLHDLIVRTHTKYTSYKELKTYLLDSDPGLDGNGVLEFYTHESITKFSGTKGTWNREHVWPQNLSNGLWGESGAGSDMHHIRPSEGMLNNSRGNKKYGNVVNGTLEYSQTTSGGNSKLGGYSSSSTFMPLDNVKGDAARIVMYVYTHYNLGKNVGGTLNSTGSGTLKFTNVMSGSEETAIQTLLEWNALDPVDEIEEKRNEEAYKIQGNRNPFIDHPEYASAIWGDGSYTPDPVDPVKPTSLTLTPSTVTMTVGGTANLTVTASPSNASKSVKWATDANTVVSVIDGRLEAHAEGQATITATSTLDSNVKATAQVTVKKADGGSQGGSTNSFTITRDSFTASGGYDFYTWSEGSVSGTAFIFGGNEEALQFNDDKSSKYLASTSAAPGPITKVTVTASEGSRSWKLLTSSTAYGEVKGKPTNGTDYGAQTVTTKGTTWNISGTDTFFALTYEDSGASYLESITVEYSSGGGTVTPDPNKLTGLSLSPTTLNLVEGKTGTLTVTRTPSTATSEQLEWTTGNSSVATVDNGTVTAKGAGNTKIKVASKTNPSVFAEATVVVTAQGAVTPPTPGETKTLTITLESFTLTDGYGFKNWSAGGVEGIAYIYGGDVRYPDSPVTSMQFSKPQSGRSYYLTNTTAVPGKITSITAKSAQYSNDWTVITSGTSFGEVSGKPTDGTSHGQKQVPTTGATWSISGNDRYFAITYDTTEYTGYLASIEVTYVADGGTVTPEPEKLTGLAVSPTKMDLVAGESQAVTVTRTPATATAEELVWTTTDGAVATYEDGKVKAVGAGQATIKVASKTNAAVYAEIQVNVTPKLTGLNLSKNSLELEINAEETVTVTANPAGAKLGTLKWESNAPTVASVENGTIKGLSAGEAKITVSVEGTEIKAEITVTVKAPAPDPSVEANAKIAAAKAAIENGTVEIQREYSEVNTEGVTLPPAYGETTLTWALQGTSEYVKVENGKLIVMALPDEDTQVTLVATISLAPGTSQTANVTITVKAKSVTPPPVDPDKEDREAVQAALGKLNDETINATKTLAASDGDVQFTWTLKTETLPKGITFSGNTITITELPDEQTVLTFEVKATLGNVTETKTVKVTVEAKIFVPDPDEADRETVEAALATLSDQTIEETTDLKTSEGTVQFTWTTETELPEGISFSGNTITVTARPAEDFAIVFTVTAKLGNVEQTKTVTVTVKAKPAPDPSVEANAKIAAAKKAIEDGTVSFQKEFTEPNTTVVDLPAEYEGATLTWALQGTSEYVKVENGKLIVSALPDTDLTLTLVATISCEHGDSQTANVTITVKAKSVTPPVDPDKADREAVEAALEKLTNQTIDKTTTLTAKDGEVQFTWTLKTEDLPKGISFNGNTITIEELPAAQTVLTFEVKATLGNVTETKTVTITVKADPDRADREAVEAVLGAQTDRSVEMSTRFKTKDGEVELTWTTETELPAGITFSDGTLTITVRPAEDFDIVFTVTAKLNNVTQSKQVTITVKAAVPDEAKVQAFHDAVAGIPTEGTPAARLTAIRNALNAYNALTDAEKLLAAEDYAALQAAVKSYNESVRSYNDAAKNAESGALSGIIG